jgi:NDP-sugar pyrophosphorylase family protein
MASTNRLIILAAGMSSRMAASLADTGTASTAAAKSMIGVGPGGRPLLDYLLANAQRAGLDDVTIVVNDRDTSIRERYARGWDGARITLAVQRIPPDRAKPLGTADAVAQALRVREDWRGARCVVCNSDNLYSVEAFAALARLAAPGGWIDYDADGLGFAIERIAQFGITVVDGEGFLLDIIEKPSIERIELQRRERGAVRVSMNIWRFDRDAILPYLDACPLHPVRDEKELPAAVRLFVAEHPRGMRAVPMSEPVPDLTRAEDIPLVASFLAREHEAPPPPVREDG